MALKATIYKAELQVSDMDRQYYATHALTLAQHHPNRRATDDGCWRSRCTPMSCWSSGAA